MMEIKVGTKLRNINTNKEYTVISIVVLYKDKTYNATDNKLYTLKDSSGEEKETNITAINKLYEVIDE